MPQTLLALFALSLAALIGFNQQRVTSQSYQTMIENEVELASSGTLMHVMEMIAARSFDEESTPLRIHQRQRVPQDSTEFSISSAFGAADRGSQGCNLMRPGRTPACDDVDDLNGLRNERVYLPLASGDSLGFDLDVNVFYVRGQDLETPSSGQTRHKKVVVTARSINLAQTDNNIVVLERVVSYDPVKAEAEFEQQYPPIGTASDD